MSTTDQARWVGQLIGEIRHSVTSHLLMLTIRLTYIMVLVLFPPQQQVLTYEERNALIILLEPSAAH